MELDHQHHILRSLRWSRRVGWIHWLQGVHWCQYLRKLRCEYSQRFPKCLFPHQLRKGVPKASGCKFEFIFLEDQFDIDPQEQFQFQLVFDQNHQLFYDQNHQFFYDQNH